MVKNYIIVHKPIKNNGDKKEYYQSQKGETFNRDEARVFRSREDAGKFMRKMTGLGYKIPEIVEK